MMLDQIDRVFREHHGRAVAILIRAFGSIDIAEEAVQDAFVVAAERWPRLGLPPSPAGWIITTARNRAIDRLRREACTGIGWPAQQSCPAQPRLSKRSTP